jgi:tetratricopeptide (TPR) repeat protein
MFCARLCENPYYLLIHKLCSRKLDTPTISNAERIGIVKSMLSSAVDEEYAKHIPNMESKNKSLSLSLRQEGNVAYQKQNHMKAHELYTQSIAAAPMDSEDLALAYANRSAALLKMGLFQECIIDIQHALRLGYPETLCFKLFLRLGQCYRNLANKAKAAENFLLAREHLDKSNLSEAERKKTSEMIVTEEKAPKVKPGCKVQMYTSPLPSVSYGQNQVAPNFSSAVDIQYNTTFGRHIVANRNIKIGEHLQTAWLTFCRHSKRKDESIKTLIINLVSYYMHCLGQHVILLSIYICYTSRFEAIHMA